MNSLLFKLEHLPEQYNGSALTLIDSLSRSDIVLSSKFKIAEAVAMFGASHCNGFLHIIFPNIICYLAF